MKTAPSNSDDVIDSCDVIARIEELTDERDELRQAIDEAIEALETNAEAFVHADAAPLEVALKDAESALATWDASDEAAELKALEALAEEAEGCATDWTYGGTLVRDSYFVDYCREMLDDTGELPKDLPSYIVIDWEKTIENLQVDYTSVKFDGVTYWIR